MALDTLRNEGVAAFVIRSIGFVRRLLGSDPPVTPFPTSPPEVEVFLPVHQTPPENLRRALESLLSGTGDEHPYRLFLLTNAKAHPDSFLFAKYRERSTPAFARVLNVLRASGPVALANSGLRIATTNAILLEVEAVVPPNWLGMLLGAARADRSVGSVVLADERSSPLCWLFTRDALHDVGVLPASAGDLPTAVREWQAAAAERGYRTVVTAGSDFSSSPFGSPFHADRPGLSPHPRRPGEFLVAFDASLLTNSGGTGTGSHLLSTARELRKRSPYPLMLYGPPSLRALEPTHYRFAATGADLLLDPLRFALFHKPVQCVTYEDTLSLLKGRRTVLTILDLIMYKNPSYFPLHRLWRRYAALTRASCAIADRITVISRSVKDDVVRTLGIPPEKIEVVYLAADARYAPIREERDLRAFRQKYGIPFPYILQIGADYPHKNQEAVLQAYALLSRENPQEHLLFVGRRMELGIRDKIIARYRRTPWFSRVHFLDYVADNDMPALYSGAAVTVCPSLDEGFGLPPLEAMACGCPVVSSQAAALPEVTGNAALPVNPRDPKDIAAKLRMVLGDTHLRNALVAEGLKNIRRFSWGSTAEALLEVYARTLDRATDHARAVDRQAGIALLKRIRRRPPRLYRREAEQLLVDDADVRAEERAPTEVRVEPLAATDPDPVHSNRS